MAGIHIRDLSLRAIVGVQDFEQENAQEVVINILFDYDASRAAQSDDINDAVDYALIRQAVVHLVASSRFNLLERMAAEILKLVMVDERVNAASVTIEKPHALESAMSVALTMSVGR